MAKDKVTITNSELGTVHAALRECGNTKIPMGVALRMVEVQRLIKLLASLVMPGSSSGIRV